VSNTTNGPTIPTPQDRDYANAAAALWITDGIAEDGWDDQYHAMTDPAFRAAVDSAFAAGWRARAPEGSEEREEFGVQFAHRADWDHGWAFVEVYEDRDEADRLTEYMASLGDRPARTMRRVAIYGPWEEVTDA